uniref:Taste receptor type 2 n=1 Tax=Nannospalax galili TaxID=1026970 RepID=A0A0N9NZK8_NANGA|nr:taste receptor type 2 member 12 [Nannospalax galili]
MDGIIQRTLIIILIVEFITGNVLNAFVALVNCMDWAKRRKISVVDQILTALAISRIGLLWSVFTGIVIVVLYPSLLLVENFMIMIHITWTATSHFTLWLATCLSIFYFFKIANFSNSLFLYLKWRVKRVVSMTLLMSLIPLCVNIFSWKTNNYICFEGFKSNVSCSSSLNNFTKSYRFLLILNTTLVSVPFTMCLTTFLLLISSLWKHHKKIQHNAQRCQDAGTTAHVKALRVIIASLLLYFIFFLSQVVQLWSSVMLKKTLTILSCQAAGVSFPSLHSCVLTLGNTKLRQASLYVWWWLRCRAKDVEPSGP